MIIYVPIFLKFDTSFDWWNSTACSYYNLGVVPYALTIAYLSAIGLRIVYMLIRSKVQDAWGIRSNLFITIMYSNVLIITFFIINIAVPNVNADYIESAYAVHLIGLIEPLHLVIWPALNTFWFKQPRMRRVYRGPAANRKSQSDIPGSEMEPPQMLMPPGVQAPAGNGGNGGTGGRHSRRPSFSVGSVMFRHDCMWLLVLVVCCGWWF